MKSTSSYFITLAIIIIVLLPFVGCEESTEIKKRNWELTWQDNFDTDGAPDASKWVYDIGKGDNGWGNNELQSYTDKASNVVVDDGKLKIMALKNGNSYTSARIKTFGKFDQKYGRFEARIKLPYGPGIWPAFWLLGANINEIPWPKCGEIDILEYKGQEPSVIHGSVHGPGYSAGASITKSYGYENNRFDVEYHVFAVEWGPDYLHFYVDETLYQDITPDDVTGDWVFDSSFFIILNLAVGGNYVGSPSTETPFPQTMYIDYVRVYKEID